MKKSLAIGLTGGIGSGKSLISELFSTLGVPIFNSDAAAKKLMNEEPLKKQIIKLLGQESYVDNSLNRPWIASQVFENKVLLLALNNIVHPAVKNYFQQWQEEQLTVYTIQETAILFESGLQSRFDKIITVVAPVEIRIQRVINRDNSNKADIQKRIDNQMSDEMKIKQSDFVIQNHSHIPLIPQILDIHSKLITLLAV